MKTVAGIVGTLVLLVGGAHLPRALAQEVTTPSINLTLTETLNRIAPGPTTKDDLREIPPPKNDRLRDNTRVTVIVGTDACLPGEDGWAGPRPPRRQLRPR